MEQRKIEHITLHLIVFGTIAIIGVLARQTVLHYCIQRCHRHTRALRHCRSLNRIFCRKICKKGRHTQFQLYRLRNDSACMGLALFLRKQLCRYHYRCHSYRHRHAMYPTQQPDQYFRHLPVCLQSGKYDFHDHLLHRRLFGYLPMQYVYIIDYQ